MKRAILRQRSRILIFGWFWRCRKTYGRSRLRPKIGASCTSSFIGFVLLNSTSLTGVSIFAKASSIYAHQIVSVETSSKMDAHHYSSSNMVQPLIEMSQDCIVEWNESQTSADPASSTPSRTLRSTWKTTPGSSSSRSTTGSSNSSREQHGPDSGGGGAATASSGKRGTTERELDAIFSLLAKDGLSQNCSTQRMHNHHQNPPKHQYSRSGPFSDLYRNRPVVSSLASRRHRQRRRPREVSGHDDDNNNDEDSTGTRTSTSANGGSKKRVQRDVISIAQHASPSLPELRSSPSIPPTSSSTSTTSTSGGSGAFDSLLKELRPPTPLTQHPSTGSNTGASTWDKENHRIVPPQPRSTNSDETGKKPPAGQARPVPAAAKQVAKVVIPRR
jgi:hypothetical protein